MSSEEANEVMNHLSIAETRVKAAMVILLEYDFFKAVENLAVGVQVLTEMQEELDKEFVGKGLRVIG